MAIHLEKDDLTHSMTIYDLDIFACYPPITSTAAVITSTGIMKFPFTCSTCNNENNVTKSSQCKRYDVILKGKHQIFIPVHHNLCF